MHGHFVDEVVDRGADGHHQLEVKLDAPLVRKFVPEKAGFRHSDELNELDIPARENQPVQEDDQDRDTKLDLGESHVVVGGFLQAQQDNVIDLLNGPGSIGKKVFELTFAFLAKTLLSDLQEQQQAQEDKTDNDLVLVVAFMSSPQLEQDEQDNVDNLDQACLLQQRRCQWLIQVHELFLEGVVLEVQNIGPYEIACSEIRR